MDSFVTIFDFQDDIDYTIGGLDNEQENFSSTLTDMIAREQENILKHVLGIEMYDEFESGYYTQVDKWLKLGNGSRYRINGVLHEWVGMKKALLPIMYAKWLRRTYDSHSANGIVVAQVENSTVIAPDIRQARAWNATVAMIGSKKRKTNTLYGFLYANLADYPTLVFHKLESVNTMSL